MHNCNLGIEMYASRGSRHRINLVLKVQNGRSVVALVRCFIDPPIDCVLSKGKIQIVVDSE